MVFTDNGKRLEYVTLSKEEGNNKEFLNYAKERGGQPGTNMSMIYSNLSLNQL